MDELGENKNPPYFRKPPKKWYLDTSWEFSPFQNLTCLIFRSSFYGTGKASKNSWLSPKEVDELVGGDGGAEAPAVLPRFSGQFCTQKPKRYGFFRKGNGTPDFREILTCRLVKYYNLARSLHRKYLEISVAMAFLSRFNKPEK